MKTRPAPRPATWSSAGRSPAPKPWAAIERPIVLPDFHGRAPGEDCGQRRARRADRSAQGLRTGPGPGTGANPIPDSHGLRRYAGPRWRYSRLPGLDKAFILEGHRDGGSGHQPDPVRSTASTTPCRGRTPPDPPRSAPPPGLDGNAGRPLAGGESPRIPDPGRERAPRAPRSRGKEPRRIRATAPMGLATVNRCEPCICYRAGPGPVPHRLTAARPCHWLGRGACGPRTRGGLDRGAAGPPSRAGKARP
jgi:hypothetical protein